MPSDAESLSLIKAFRRIARAVEIQSRRIERDAGLTLPQLVVLGSARALGESATTRAIAAEADISDATVVAILEKLEGKGLIERRRSERDRRVVHTRVTFAGEAALATAPSVLGDGFDRAFAALEGPDRRALLSAFDRVADMAAPPAPTLARSG
jgi:DNA-binding MarR family transcriptional regulator